MVLYPAVNAHRHHQVNSAPLRRLWGGPRPGSLEHRMGESSGPAEVLAPRVDLEGTVDFMKKWGGGLIVEVDVKAIGPLVLTGGHL